MADFKYLTSAFTYVGDEIPMTPWIPTGENVVTGKRKRSYSTSDLPFPEVDNSEQECKRKKLNDGSRSRETTPDSPFDFFASSPASSFTIHNDSDSAGSPITPDLLEENWSSYFEFNKYCLGSGSVKAESKNEKERMKKISKRRERKKRENSKENINMGRSNSCGGYVQCESPVEIQSVDMVRVPLSPKYNDPAFTRPLNKKLTRRTTWGWNAKPTEMKVQKHTKKPKVRSMSDSGILLIYRSLSDITGNTTTTAAEIYAVESSSSSAGTEERVEVVDNDAALMLMGLGDEDEEVRFVVEPDNDIYHSSSEDDEGIEGMDTDDEMMLGEEELELEEGGGDNYEEDDDDDDL